MKPKKNPRYLFDGDPGGWARAGNLCCGLDGIRSPYLSRTRIVISAAERGYAGVVVVTKRGGDFTSVQAAIDSVSEALADSPHLIWVAPGVYSETVELKPYIHLQGASQDTITSAASSESLPAVAATVVLSSHTSLRSLKVVNRGTGEL